MYVNTNPKLALRTFVTVIHVTCVLYWQNCRPIGFTFVVASRYCHASC